MSTDHALTIVARIIAQAERVELELDSLEEQGLSAVAQAAYVAGVLEGFGDFVAALTAGAELEQVA